MLFVGGVAEPMWRRLRQPSAPPSWLDAADFEYFVAQFRRSGFQGGLNWYSVMDFDWHATPQLEGRKLSQPVCFIAGSADPVLRWFGGPKGAAAQVSGACQLAPEFHFLDAGHWVQQEKHAEVSAALLGFLATHAALFARVRGSML